MYAVCSDTLNSIMIQIGYPGADNVYIQSNGSVLPRVRGSSTTTTMQNVKWVEEGSKRAKSQECLL